VSDSRVKSSAPIWIDERNPIYRRGLRACLEAEGYSIVGESAWLRPMPDLAATSVLILDVDGAGTAQVRALARSGHVRLVGVMREASPEHLATAMRVGLAGVLPLRELTPRRLLACISALDDGDAAAARGQIAPPPVRVDNGRHRALSEREFDVLCLLADGDSTRDIAMRLSYSERTVKNIVHDVLEKLNGRTRAHAVALAARRGVI
jgi:DNA-binding NarL/FixJ family response regulator